MMLVSFVIPVFNYAEYLEECVESILYQNLLNSEIVIVDDGSTDQTQEVAQCIINKHKNAVIRYYFQINTGPSAARNAGVKFACGKYIWLIDADDRLIPGAARRLVDVAKSDPDIALVYSGHCSVDVKGRKKDRL